MPETHKDGANMPTVEARNLSRTYTLGGEQIRALDGVSLSVSRGEFVCVMGASGSGKSTLLHLLGLLEAPDSGEVLLDGATTRGLSDDVLTRLRRDRLGFVFQTFELIPNLTGRENVLLPAEIAGRLSEGLTRLEALAQTLGIKDRLGHRPSQLSGGQRQRIAIARALINDPVVVLADEPTGNLDSKTGQDVLGLLRQGVSQEGWTVVMVTHDPVAAQYADRIVFLADGRVSGQVTAEGDMREAILEHAGV